MYRVQLGESYSPYMPDIGISFRNPLVHLVVAAAEVHMYSCAGVELSQ